MVKTTSIQGWPCLSWLANQLRSHSMLLYCATRLQIVDRAGEMKVHCDENTVSIVVFRSLYAILAASIYPWSGHDRLSWDLSKCLHSLQFSSWRMNTVPWPNCYFWGQWASWNFQLFFSKSHGFLALTVPSAFFFPIRSQTHFFLLLLSWRLATTFLPALFLLSFCSFPDNIVAARRLHGRAAAAFSSFFFLLTYLCAWEASSHRRRKSIKPFAYLNMDPIIFLAEWSSRLVVYYLIYYDKDIILPADSRSEWFTTEDKNGNTERDTFLD